MTPRIINMKKLLAILFLVALGLVPWTGYAQEAVDLGLSVKWATCNVGASSPTDYGGLYAWGEVEEKEECFWHGYKWCGKKLNDSLSESERFSFLILHDEIDLADLTKYCESDGKTRLDYSDDVARRKWGKKWRIPTDEEWTELRENCTWEWRGNGYKVSSNKNGKSIFLPAAGWRFLDWSRINAPEHGWYWSSSLDTENPKKAWQVSIGLEGECHYAWVWLPGTEKVERQSEDRYFGCSIRPVTE